MLTQRLKWVTKSYIKFAHQPGQIDYVPVGVKNPIFSNNAPIVDAVVAEPVSDSITIENAALASNNVDVAIASTVNKVDSIDSNHPSVNSIATQTENVAAMPVVETSDDFSLSNENDATATAPVQTTAQEPVQVSEPASVSMTAPATSGDVSSIEQTIASVAAPEQLSEVDPQPSIYAATVLESTASSLDNSLTGVPAQDEFPNTIANAAPLDLNASNTTKLHAIPVERSKEALAANAAAADFAQVNRENVGPDFSTTVLGMVESQTNILLDEAHKISEETSKINERIGEQERRNTDLSIEYDSIRKGIAVARDAKQHVVPPQVAAYNNGVSASMNATNQVGNNLSQSGVSRSHANYQNSTSNQSYVEQNGGSGMGYDSNRDKQANGSQSYYNQTNNGYNQSVNANNAPSYPNAMPPANSMNQGFATSNRAPHVNDGSVAQHVAPSNNKIAPPGTGANAANIAGNPSGFINTNRMPAGSNSNVQNLNYAQNSRNNNGSNYIQHSNAPYNNVAQGQISPEQMALLNEGSRSQANIAMQQGIQQDMPNPWASNNYSASINRCFDSPELAANGQLPHEYMVSAANPMNAQFNQLPFAQRQMPPAQSPAQLPMTYVQMPQGQMPQGHMPIGQMPQMPQAQLSQMQQMQQTPMTQAQLQQMQMQQAQMQRAQMQPALMQQPQMQHQATQAQMQRGQIVQPQSQSQQHASMQFASTNAQIQQAVRVLPEQYLNPANSGNKPDFINGQMSQMNYMSPQSRSEMGINTQGWQSVSPNQGALSAQNNTMSYAGGLPGNGQGQYNANQNANVGVNNGQMNSVYAQQNQGFAPNTNQIQNWPNDQVNKNPSHAGNGVLAGASAISNRAGVNANAGNGSNQSFNNVANMSRVNPNGQVMQQSTAQIAAMSQQMMPAMPQQQINGMTQQQMQAMTPQQMQSMSQQQMHGLTQSQMSGLTQSQMSGMAQPQMSGMSQQQAPGLTQSQLPAMTQQQMLAMSQQQMNTMSPSSMAMMQNQPMVAQNPVPGMDMYQLQTSGRGQAPTAAINPSPMMAAPANEFNPSYNNTTSAPPYPREQNQRYDGFNAQINNRINNNRPNTPGFSNQSNFVNAGNKQGGSWDGGYNR